MRAIATDTSRDICVSLLATTVRRVQKRLKLMFVY